MLLAPILFQCLSYAVLDMSRPCVTLMWAWDLRSDYYLSLIWKLLLCHFGFLRLTWHSRVGCINFFPTNSVSFSLLFRVFVWLMLYVVVVVNNNYRLLGWEIIVILLYLDWHQKSSVFIFNWIWMDIITNSHEERTSIRLFFMFFFIIIFYSVQRCMIFKSEILYV